MEDKQQGGRSGSCWREHLKLPRCTVNCTDFSAHLKAEFECFVLRQGCEWVLGFQVWLIFCQMKCWPCKALVLLSLKLMGSRVFTSWGSLAYNKYKIVPIISPVKIELTDTVRRKLFPAQEFNTHKKKWVDFLISKYNYYWFGSQKSYSFCLGLLWCGRRV